MSVGFKIVAVFFPGSKEICNLVWEYINFALLATNIVVSVILYKLKEKLPYTDKFNTYIEKKNEILYTMSPLKYPEEISRQCLHLIIDCLKEYIGDDNFFEVSIFTNAQAPYIYAYYDTNGNNSSSSYPLWQENHQYYIEKKYAVIELLKCPSTEIHIISATKEEDYNFVTEEQRTHILSQVMYCFHMENPYALVITCNKKNAFKKKDKKLKKFVQDIGRILDSDIIIKERICC